MYQLLDPPRPTGNDEPDPWTGTTWKVYVGSAHLKPMDRVGEFTLVAIADGVSRATAYYRVEFAEGGMPACWRGCLLHPRGRVAFAKPVPALPRWSSSTDGAWSAAAAAALDELNDTKARLEADLIDANIRPLTLIRIDNANIEGAPLLAMRLTSSDEARAYGSR